MIRPVAIDHLVIRSQKPQQLINWYTTVLGCQLEMADEKNQGLTQLRAGNALIDIVAVDNIMGRAGGSAPKTKAHNMDHFCIQIEPIEKKQLLVFLNQHQVDHGQFEARYGAQGFGKSIYLKDPEGNGIELVFKLS